VTPLRGTCSGAINGVMTPDEALTLYRPIRAGIQRVLKTGLVGGSKFRVRLQ
jgi:hypothetical protein